MNPPPQPSSSSATTPLTAKAPTTKTPSLNTTSRRGIQGEKWTPAEEHRLRNLWNEFQGRSASRYAVEIWLPISSRMPGRKPDACHQKAYRMGLLSEKGGREPSSAGSGPRRASSKRVERKAAGSAPAAAAAKRAERVESSALGKRRAVADEVMEIDEEEARPVQAQASAQLINHQPAVEIEPVHEEPVGWVATRPEDAWKHDRSSARGIAWREERHEARKKWEKGVHPKNLERFCPSVCEGCEEDRLYGM